MRRLFAFIVLTVTLLTISIMNIPSISDNMNQGIEFKGGFEILYQVLDQDGIEYSDRDKESAVSAAAEVISNRIDIAGVKNPQISTEGDDMIRVTVASKKESETKSIRDLLTSNAEISFRDVNDNLLATADQLLKDNGAVLDYSDGNPVVSLKIKDTTLWEDITRYISTQEDSDNRHIVIWLGYESQYDEVNDYGYSGDSYADISSNPDASNKIVSDATVSQVFYGDVIITGSFTDELAGKMANMIRAGTINFTLKEISVSSIGATYGNEAFNKSLIAGLIGILAVSVFMIIFYGIAGVASSVALIVYVISTLFGFNLLKGEYGPDTIAATVMAIGMAVDANIISFERIKDELYKGRSLRKAFLEGNKKSLSTILDANITTLIAALSLYVFGTRTVKGFATMLIISIFATMIIMVFLAKFLLSLLCQSKVFQNRQNWFGVKKNNLPDVQKGEGQKYFGRFSNANFMKPAKKFAFSSSSFIALGLVMIIVYHFALGSGLNLGLQFSQGTKLYFKTADPSFSTTEQVESFFVNNEDIAIKPDLIVIGDDSAEVSTALIESNKDLLDGINAEVSENVLKLYTVSVSFKQELSSDVMDYLNEYFSDNKAEFFDLYNNSYTLNFVSPLVATKTVQNALWSLLIASGFIIIYVAWRFKFTYAAAAIIALIHDSLFMVAAFSLFRIEINIEFVSAVLAIIGYSINDTIVTFDRLRENISESNIPQLSNNDRIDLVNKSLQQTVGRSILTTISTLLTVISLLIFGSSASFNFNLAMLFGLTAGTYSSIFIAPVLWLWFEKIKDKLIISRKEKRKDKTVVKSNEPEEYTFYGIND